MQKSGKHNRHFTRGGCTMAKKKPARGILLKIKKLVDGMLGAEEPGKKKKKKGKKKKKK
jgi:hypothetical protein